MMAQTLLNQPDDQGKVPLMEIMINSSAIARIIRSGHLHELEEAMVTSRGLGSQTTDMGLRDLLTRHLISEEEALFHATDREAVLANRGLPTRDRLRR